MSRALCCLILLAAGGFAGPRLAAAEAAETDWQALRRELDRRFAAELSALAEKCDALKLPEQAAVTRAWPLPRGPGRSLLCFDPGDDLAAPPATAPLVQRQWHAAFGRARAAQAAAILDLARRAHEAGQWELAYAWAHDALREDPQNELARRLVGYARSPQGWSPATLPVVTANRTPHPKLPGKVAWRVESEHFRIATNHSAAEGERLARRLEELHAVWRQLFARYWTNANALSLAWKGAAPMPRGLRTKHQVVLFRTREEYTTALRPAQARIDLTEGIYLDREKTSYFFVGDEQVEATWRHEATHQLFHEVGANVAPQIGEAANFWAIEGVALYLESLTPREGYACVGGWDAGRLQFARNWALQGDFYVRLVQFAALDRRTIQSDPNIRQLYSQAAGVAHFLMDAQNGRYRGPLVDYLRAVYSGRDRADSLAVLTGVDFAALDVEYVQFLQLTDATLAETPPLRERRQLCLGATRVTDAGLARLPTLARLDWLDLGRLKIGDDGLRAFRGSTALTQLNLEQTAITDAGLTTVALFPKLEELDLSQTAITDDGLAALRELTGLKVLFLSNTAISDAGLEHLRGLTKLERLELTGTRVTDAGRAKLKRGLPAWKE